VQVLWRAGRHDVGGGHLDWHLPAELITPQGTTASCSSAALLRLAGLESESEVENGGKAARLLSDVSCLVVYKITPRQGALAVALESSRRGSA
jgi:hypothetical protein